MYTCRIVRLRTLSQAHKLEQGTAFRVRLDMFIRRPHAPNWRSYLAVAESGRHSKRDIAVHYCNNSTLRLL